MDRIAYFPTARNQRNRAFLIHYLRRLQILKGIPFRNVHGKVAVHYMQALYLLGHQVHAIKRGYPVRLRIQQAGDVGERAGGDEHHTAVLLFYQQLAKGHMAFVDTGFEVALRFYQRRTVGFLCRQRGQQIGVVLRVRTVVGESERDVREAVPAAYTVHELHAVRVALGDGYAFQVDEALVVVIEQHLKGEGIVDIVTHVGIKDDRDGFLSAGRKHQGGS